LPILAAELKIVRAIATGPVVGALLAHIPSVPRAIAQPIAQLFPYLPTLSVSLTDYLVAFGVTALTFVVKREEAENLGHIAARVEDQLNQLLLRDDLNELDRELALHVVVQPPPDSESAMANFNDSIAQYIARHHVFVPGQPLPPVVWDRVEQSRQRRLAQVLALQFNEVAAINQAILSDPQAREQLVQQNEAYRLRHGGVPVIARN